MRTVKHATAIPGASALVALLLVSGCGSSEAGLDGGMPDGAIMDAAVDAELVYSTCELADAVGGFEVELAERYTGVSGRVLDAIVPLYVFEEVERVGECRRMRAPSLFCDPACDPGQSCSASGVCVDDGASQDVGTVTVTGLEVALEMSPTTPGNNYTNPGSLPHPGFTEGAAIELSTSGGECAPFTLRGEGVAAIEVLTEEVVVGGGAPVDIVWVPPAVETTARIRLSLSVNQHGGTGQWIECDVEDTGSFSIPEALVTSLVGLGLSGFPSMVIARQTSDSVAIESGCVELQVVSETELPVTVPGLVSCSSDEDCPVEESCGGDLTCG